MPSSWIPLHIILIGMCYLLENGKTYGYNLVRCLLLMLVICVTTCGNLVNPIVIGYLSNSAYSLEIQINTDSLIYRVDFTWAYYDYFYLLGLIFLVIYE